MISRAKTRRAWLCGRRERRARSLALVQAAGLRRSVSRSTTISTGAPGTRCRSRTAAATTFAMASRPLIAATAAGSVPLALMPG